MNEVCVRLATQSDVPAIANVHTRSWRTAYSHILAPKYLQESVQRDHISMWADRVNLPGEKMLLFVAVRRSEVIGFICIFVNTDPKWGPLIENLHVMPEEKGRGVGKLLLYAAATAITKGNLDSPVHLWVYGENHQSRHIYERLEGEPAGFRLEEGPDGRQVEAVRYAWRSAKKLADRCSILKAQR